MLAGYNCQFDFVIHRLLYQWSKDNDLSYDDILLYEWLVSSKLSEDTDSIIFGKGYYCCIGSWMRFHIVSSGNSQTLRC